MAIISRNSVCTHYVRRAKFKRKYDERHALILDLNIEFQEGCKCCMELCVIVFNVSGVLRR